MKSWMLIGLSMVGGAVASVVVSRTLVRETSSASPARMEAAAATPLAARAAQDGRPRTRMEQQLAELRAARNDEDEDRAELREPPARPERQDADYPTEEQAAARNRQAHRDRVAAVQAQPADPTWAPGAQTRFTDDLEELGATVDGVDCRRTGCVATLEWTDRAEAQQAYRQLVEAEYHLPCDRRIFLDGAAGEGNPYRAELLLDCEHVRASEN